MWKLLKFSVRVSSLKRAKVIHHSLFLRYRKPAVPAIGRMILLDGNYSFTIFFGMRVALAVSRIKSRRTETFPLSGGQHIKSVIACSRCL